MDTLDEQLETANAKIAEQEARITAQGDEITDLTAANEELKANLAHAREQLAASDAACAKANAEVAQLKAEAKSAEARAAEYYGIPAKPQQVTAKGDPEPTSVFDRFKAITLEYTKPKSDDEDDEEEEDDDTTTDDDEIVEEEDIEEWSLDGSVNDEPLLAHPKAQAQMSDDQREYLKAVIDGTRMWEKVAALNKDGSPKVDKDGQQLMKPLKELLQSSLSANGQAILKMIMSGIHSYRSPAATYRETKYVSSGNVSLGGLGKIASPSGAPGTGSRNWLMVGCNFSRNSQSKKGRWRVEYLYELSAEGGWNKDLYS